MQFREETAAPMPPEGGQQASRVTDRSAHGPTVNPEVFREFVESLAVPVAIADRQGRMVTWSSSMASLYGVDPEKSVSGLPVHRALRLESEPVEKMQEGNHFTLPVPASLVSGASLPSGDHPWLELRFTPMASSDGELWDIRLRGTHNVFGGRRDVLEFADALVPESNLYAAALQQLDHRAARLVQSERMAGIGHLAAGVAHEINNPVGYVSSNMQSLRDYVASILFALDSLEQVKLIAGADSEVGTYIDDMRRRADLDFIRADLVSLVDESIDGVDRVRQIVQALKDFSHGGDGGFVTYDLHEAIESTLRVAWNELKYKAEVLQEFGDLPEIDCIPSQINQVILNLLVNAAHAIETEGVITLRTGVEGDRVWLEVEDNGSGIDSEQVSRIFEPFFTTKPAGEGSGLGLALSSSIVQRHGGNISVTSQKGKGTSFRVTLPVRRPETGG